MLPSHLGGLVWRGGSVRQRGSARGRWPSRSSPSTSATGQRQGVQYVNAWGKKLNGTVSQTQRSYTGQHLDDSGLLFYNARYYDAGIGRFVSADSIVPGNASGGMAGIAYKPLTVDVHEPGFVAKIAQENQFGPWYSLSDKEKQQLGAPWGPANPQALNRYSYVLNNPMRWTDPGGHTWYLGNKETNDLILLLSDLKADAGGLGTVLGAIASGGNAGAIVAALAEKLGITSNVPALVVPLLVGLAAAFLAGALTASMAAYWLDKLIIQLQTHNGAYGVALGTDELSRGIYILNRETGDAVYWQPGMLYWPVMAYLPRSLRLGEWPPIVMDSKNPRYWEHYYWNQDDRWVVKSQKG